MWQCHLAVRTSTPVSLPGSPWVAGRAHTRWPVGRTPGSKEPGKRFAVPSASPRKMALGPVPCCSLLWGPPATDLSPGPCLSARWTPRSFINGSSHILTFPFHWAVPQAHPPSHWGHSLPIPPGDCPRPPSGSSPWSLEVQRSGPLALCPFIVQAPAGLSIRTFPPILAHKLEPLFPLSPEIGPWEAQQKHPPAVSLLAP